MNESRRTPVPIDLQAHRKRTAEISKARHTKQRVRNDIENVRLLQDAIVAQQNRVNRLTGELDAMKQVVAERDRVIIEMMQINRIQRLQQTTQPAASLLSRFAAFLKVFTLRPATDTN